jgi:ribosomal protein L11 methyltransferase
MTDWLEISLIVDGEGAEAVADVLRRYVHQGVSIEHHLPGEAWSDEPLPPGPLVVRGYIPVDSQTDALRQQIADALGYMRMMYPIPEPEFTIVREEDWAEAWKRHYHPIRVGQRILIKPAWAEVAVQPDDIVISMDPGMAFGTGTHPTTQLCLQACEWFCKPGMCMVDLGTGSGVLAIAAARLGCYKVLGLDTDETAVRVAQENVERNGVADRVTIQHGSLDCLQTTARHFDLAMCNLTAKIILSMVPEGLQNMVWPYGRVVFSGIIDEQAPEVVSALDGIGLELQGQRQIGDWVMLVTRRRAP